MKQIFVVCCAICFFCISCIPTEPPNAQVVETQIVLPTSTQERDLKVFNMLSHPTELNNMLWTIVELNGKSTEYKPVGRIYFREEYLEITDGCNWHTPAGDGNYGKTDLLCVRIVNGEEVPWQEVALPIVKNVADANWYALTGSGRLQLFDNATSAEPISEFTLTRKD